MGFKEIKINKEYRIPRDNIAKELYIPLLKEATLYKRSVGFFTSSALLEIATGITHLVNNDGKILLIVSPYLENEDIDAINKGYELRDDIIERALLKYLSEPQTYFEEEKLNLLATLIAQEKLDLKIAFSYKNNKLGLYHEKMGIFYDEDNNRVAFSGSMNESQTAFVSNYETIDVYTSWTSEDENQRVGNKDAAFEKLWNNIDNTAKVMEFPEAVKRKLLGYKKDSLDINFLEEEEDLIEETNSVIETATKSKKVTNIPTIPEGVNLFPYQEEAIKKWKANNYRGIFDMATGTGKTFTGLGAITKLFEEKREKLAVVIVCPQQHLVNQWVEDIYKFNISPIIGHSESIQKDFKRRLKDAVIDYNLDLYNFFCFVCTNATYSSQLIQEELKKIEGDILLVVDEAHNFGAETLVRTLDNKYTYRLALSATFERHNDEQGTALLKDFFGEKCIEFTLDDAIEQGYLTPYRYYPIVVSLDDEELEEYKKITSELVKCLIKDKHGNYVLNEKGKILVLKRARIVAGAKEKVEKLKELLYDYKEDNHLLVYCGATTLIDDSNQFIEEKRQIDIITEMMSKEHGMKVSQFTSREDNKEREILKKEFGEGKNLQALIAIKCLDEGVNIPQIKTAFILASTTNPKEYIQRRGRVLRKYKGKQFATIYDFVTLPRKIENIWNLTSEELVGEKTLAKNELNRVVEFKRLALNPIDSDKIIGDIREAYQLWKEDEEEVYI